VRDVLPLFGTIAAALWLTIAPQVLGYGEPARSLHHIAGPLLAAIACVACWDVVRALRWLDVALAALVAALSIVPPFLAPAAAVNGLITAALAGTLCFITPAARGNYGGGWRALLRRT
jgi:hypothetical protein